MRYISDEEGSDRWTRFAHRPGDIVISTRSKSGTTWLQMICALLVLRTPELPRPLGELSPWLDWLVSPEEEVFAGLAAQSHRRFIKTHTPLDGLPWHAEVTYIVAGRHPLDLALSLYHQGRNLDRARIAELTGAPEAASPTVPEREWLRAWISRDADPRTAMDSLPGVLAHLRDAWSRRHEPNVLLVHYDDLLADLGSEMRRVAAALGIAVPVTSWPSLIGAASFAAMRSRAPSLVPDRQGVLRDPSAFFRQGRSGSGSAAVSRADLALYRSRVAALAPPDLLAWLHRGR
ncbi:sulfotransferase domain-containing protein [Actinoplanes sp. NPDC051851]|uniref:sulfotransferase domain-containing protein n=1 Tax=Actinoplanes sp. NPDC051851 TaxID=3154753 RepID=UPI0034416108